MLDTAPVVSSSEFDRQRYAAVGRALADPKRLCVLESLAAGEVSVSDLSTRVGCQVPNMSQHLAVLRSAGLVQPIAGAEMRTRAPTGRVTWRVKAPFRAVFAAEPTLRHPAAVARCST